MTNDGDARDVARRAARRLHAAVGGDDAHSGRGDRAGRAALCRIGVRTDDVRGEVVDVVPALSVPAFRAFLADLGLPLRGDPPAWRDERLEYAAVAAMAIAHVRKDDRDARSTARLLGARKAADREPLFAEARFLRLMRAETPADLLPQAKRLVAILDRIAPVGDLGESLASWGPGVRKRWPFDYWYQRQPDAAEDAAQVSV